MAPHEKPVPSHAEPTPTFPGCDPERLRKATELAHALGLEGEVVHSTDDPDEMRAYLESLWASAPTS
jgi:hypothetical protein